MDVAWIAPPAVLGAGALAVGFLARRLAVAVAELAAAERRFRRLEDALIPLRVETRRTRASVDQLRHR